MRNYAYKLIGEIGLRVLSTAFTLVLARVVGAKDFGLYSSALAFASVFMIFVDLGINPIVTREIARYPAKREHLVATVNSLKTLTAMIMLLGLWITTLWVDMPPEKAQLIQWLGWFVVGTAFIDYLSAIFTGLERMKAEAVLKIISKAIVVLAGLVVLHRHRSLLPTVKSMAAFSLLSIAVGGILIRKHLGTFGFSADPRLIKTLLVQSLPIFGSWAFLVLYDSQHILVLNYFKIPDSQIGFFAAAAKIIDVLKIFPILLATAYFPSLTRQALISKEALLKRSKEVFRYALAGVPLLSGGIFFGAPLILKTLYGSPYGEASSVLRWLAGGFLVFSFNQIFIHWLIAVDRERYSFMAAAMLLAANVGTSLFWVPRAGILGTCYAFLVSQGVFLFVLAGLVVWAARHLNIQQLDPKAALIDSHIE